ncbi:hypothetical protein F9C11_26715 [Amycolatopsis sp. VS8301801F10]|uniref:hypothetical protein n=1 Tax=unclassified Amycolatopsis TaxID=2618356 RepID=UPI0038FC95BC
MNNVTAGQHDELLDLWAEESDANLAADGCTLSSAGCSGSASTFSCPAGSASTAGSGSTASTKC